MPLKLIAFREGIHAGAIIEPDNGKYAEPGDTKLMFALASVDAYGKTLGARLLRFRAEDDTDAPDDFFDRALVGITICHGRLILEILFIRIMLT